MRIIDWSSDVCSSDLPYWSAAEVARTGIAAQLFDEFSALREARGAERMALRQQAAGRIGDVLAAVGVVAISDELHRAAFRAQTEQLGRASCRENVGQYG